MIITSKKRLRMKRLHRQQKIQTERVQPGCNELKFNFRHYKKILNQKCLSTTHSFNKTGITKDNTNLKNVAYAALKQRRCEFFNFNGILSQEFNDYASSTKKRKRQQYLPIILLRFRSDLKLSTAIKGVYH